MFSQSNTTFSSHQMDEKIFGTIKFQVSDTVARQTELNIAMIMDNSSSMDDACDSSGRKRMQYAKFTAEQLCRKAQENATFPINVSLTTFDTTIVSVFDMQELTSDTVGEMASKISNIHPNSSTDIGEMLNEIIRMAQVKSEFVAFILTDGQATSGETDVQKLIKHACKIPETVQLELIGYGADHDFRLLKGTQQARPNTGYRFIAEFEKSSFACSEIIYNLLNRVAKNVHIRVVNGEIYNWKNNSWVPEIHIDNLVTKMNKTYAVRSNDPTQFRATICGILIETNESFEYDISTEPLPLENLTKEWLRNKTMKTVYEAGQIDDTLRRNEKAVREHNMKEKLTDLMVEIKKYMDENQLREDKILTMLCDDIFTCHETIGTRNGNMYIHARQTSQGTQSIYRVEPPKAMYFEPSDFMLSLPKLGRSVSMQVGHMKKTQPMKISVKTLEGLAFELITDESETMEDIITMISEETKTPPLEISVGFNGKEVDYYGTIRSNGICDGDILEIYEGMPSRIKEEDIFGDIQNCSMSFGNFPPTPPSYIRRAPVIQGHTMSSIEDSPYIELNTFDFMKETSIQKPTNNI